jgi:hypothetical protein
MKSTLSAAALLLACSANAEMTLNDTAEALQSSNCINYLSTGIDTIAKFNPKTKKAIEDNLEGYSNLIKDIRFNLGAGKSNSANYAQIATNINSYKEGSSKTGNLGVTEYLYQKSVEFLSEKVAECIESNINFNGTVKAQDVAAQRALKIIGQIRSEMNN